MYNQYGPGDMGGRPSSYHNPGAFELDRKITLQFVGEHLDAKDRGTMASTSCFFGGFVLLLIRLYPAPRSYVRGSRGVLEDQRWT